MSTFEAAKPGSIKCKCGRDLGAHNASTLACPPKAPPSPDLSRDEIKALARDGGSCTACQWNDAAESKCVLTGDCHRVVCNPEDPRDPPRFAGAERCTFCGRPLSEHDLKGDCPTKAPIERALATLPTDAQERKAVPIYSGVLRYFPDALAEVARCSKKGNDQHNPGKPLHWDRSKSTDELDALTRHLVEAGTVDTDGIRHSAKIAWRALANLQKEIEAAR